MMQDFLREIPAAVSRNIGFFKFNAMYIEDDFMIKGNHF